MLQGFFYTFFVINGISQETSGFRDLRKYVAASKFAYRFAAHGAEFTNQGKPFVNVAAVYLSVDMIDFVFFYKGKGVETLILPVAGIVAVFSDVFFRTVVFGKFGPAAA